jgi:hypothetical protein
MLLIAPVSSHAVNLKCKVGLGDLERKKFSDGIPEGLLRASDNKIKSFLLGKIIMVGSKVARIHNIKEVRRNNYSELVITADLDDGTSKIVKKDQLLMSEDFKIYMEKQDPALLPPLSKGDRHIITAFSEAESQFSSESKHDVNFYGSQTRMVLKGISDLQSTKGFLSKIASVRTLKDDMVGKIIVAVEISHDSQVFSDIKTDIYTPYTGRVIDIRGAIQTNEMSETSWSNKTIWIRTLTGVKKLYYSGSWRNENTDILVIN